MPSPPPSPPHPVALITGSGTGIGRATAAVLAAAGYAVVLTGRREAPLRETAATLATPTLIHPADITDPAAARALVEATEARFARLDALVNNAGLAPLRPIDQTDPATIDAVFAANALAPAYLTHFAWPLLKRTAAGHATSPAVVNVSTMGTRDPFPGFFAYAAAKASVNLMALSIATEGRPHNIRGYAVAPGAVETDMLRALFPPSAIAPASCLQPSDVARVIVECILGGRPNNNGATIFLPSP